MVYEVEYKWNLGIRYHWESTGHTKWTLRSASKLAAMLASNLKPPKPYLFTKDFRVVKRSTGEVMVAISRVCDNRYGH